MPTDPKPPKTTVPPLDQVSSRPFEYQRRVAYYETDAMGVVHHSNYLRYFEEARVAWLKAAGLAAEHFPNGKYVLAVLLSSVEHHRPIHFDDGLTVQVLVRREGLKIHFHYAILADRWEDQPAAFGTTTHVMVDKDLRPQRLPMVLREYLEEGQWIGI